MRTVDFGRIDVNLRIVERRLFDIWFEEIHCRNQTFLFFLLLEREVERRLREIDGVGDIYTEGEL